MGKDHEGAIKRYVIASQAWYRDAHLNRSDRVDEVTFGYIHEDGGGSGDMAMVWQELGEKEPVPYLKVYCDGWHTLSQFGDLIEVLAELDNVNVTPIEFCSILQTLGFVDRTERCYPPYPLQRNESNGRD